MELQVSGHNQTKEVMNLNNASTCNQKQTKKESRRMRTSTTK
jgi:hypothetical protein